MSFARYFPDYADAFNAFDAERIAAFFHVPCFLVDAASVVRIDTPEAMRDAMEDRVRRHREQDFGRAAIVSVEVRSPAATLAIATVRWTVTRRDGSLLWDFCNSYNLVDHGGGWKILVSTTHETPTP